jgi:hypothetical protein
MTELLLTQHCFITITYLNSLQNKPKERNLNKQRFGNLRSVFIMRRTYCKGRQYNASLVEHNDRPK